jgi:hypothetical protein
MYRTKKHRVDHRIVSFDQPYVRPIRVLADKIYATRANRQFCKAVGIHL